MRYFAMIDGEQRGPFELSELSAAGVGPDTYVWCKGMSDWQKAEDVADICRHFRQRLSDIMHPQAPAPDPKPMQYEGYAPGVDPYESVPLRYRNMVRRSGEVPGEPIEQPTDTSRPPAPTLFLSLLMTLFCFPITGLVAVYYSYKARAAWQESQRSESNHNRALYNDNEREQLRKAAHDYDRQAKMWIGITFFLSVILYAFLGNRFF